MSYVVAVTVVFPGIKYNMMINYNVLFIYEIDGQTHPKFDYCMNYAFVYNNNRIMSCFKSFSKLDVQITQLALNQIRK